VSSLSAGRMVAAVVAAFAIVCMTLLDLVGLLAHDSDPSLPSFGRLFLAIIFGMGVAVAMRPSQDRITALPPYERFMQASKFIVIATFFLLIGQWIAAAPVFSFLHIIFSYIVAAMTVVLVVREVLWLDALIRIRRTSHTEKVRSVFAGG